MLELEPDDQIPHKLYLMLERADRIIGLTGGSLRSRQAIASIIVAYENLPKRLR